MQNVSRGKKIALRLLLSPWAPFFTQNFFNRVTHNNVYTFFLTILFGSLVSNALWQINSHTWRPILGPSPQPHVAPPCTWRLVSHPWTCSPSSLRDPSHVAGKPQFFQDLLEIFTVQSTYLFYSSQKNKKQNASSDKLKDQCMYFAKK